MNRESIEVPILKFSVMIYQALLAAYPAKFRQEYGSHMAQVFRDCCLQAVHQHGTNGMLRLWAITLLDFIRSVLEQHFRKETNMSRSLLIKFSSWAFILGSVIFLIYIGNPSDSLALGCTILMSILLAIGLVGLRARYGSKVGGFGSQILLIGVIGMVLVYLGIALLAVVGNLIPPEIQTQILPNINQSAWIWLFVGPAILLLTLAIFGLRALSRKPLARFNWLPAFTGIWYPIFFLFVTVYLYSNNGEYPVQLNTMSSAIAVIQFITLCALGLVLITEKTQEMATA